MLKEKRRVCSEALKHQKPCNSGPHRGFLSRSEHDTSTFSDNCPCNLPASNPSHLRKGKDARFLMNKMLSRCKEHACKRKCFAGNLITFACRRHITAVSFSWSNVHYHLYKFKVSCSSNNHIWSGGQEHHPSTIPANPIR